LKIDILIEDRNHDEVMKKLCKKDKKFCKSLSLLNEEGEVALDCKESSTLCEIA
jgi:hypothetical protein